MYRTSLLKIALFLLLVHVTAAPGWAQWATPTIDGFIANGEYGTNNQLNNAGGTGQTWYMTWDVSNLYVGMMGPANHLTITNSGLASDDYGYVGYDITSISNTVLVMVVPPRAPIAK